MAYNNAFPIGYQPMYYPNVQQNNIPVLSAPQNVTPQTQQVPQNNSNIIWVKEGDVMNYFVTPNNAVALWDSDKQVIYLKQTDATGKPSIRVADYVFRDEQKIADDKNDLDDKLSALQGDVDDLKKQLEVLKKGRKKNEDAE